MTRVPIKLIKTYKAMLDLGRVSKLAPRSRNIHFLGRCIPNYDIIIRPR